MINFDAKELACDYDGYRCILYVDAIAKNKFYKSGYCIHIAGEELDSHNGWLDCGWFVRLTGVKKGENRLVNNQAIIKKVLGVEIID